MSNQQVKSLRKSNEELKKLLASARSDIKSLEERVGAQELVVREGANGGREAQLETERSLEWLHDSESSFQSELHGIRKQLDDIEESLRKLEIAFFSTFHHFFFPLLTNNLCIQTRLF